MPLRFVSSAFLAIVAVAVAECAQIVGVLLVFTLMVGPAAAAMNLTRRLRAGDRAVGGAGARRGLGRPDARLLHRLADQLLDHRALRPRLLRRGRRRLARYPNSSTHSLDPRVGRCSSTRRNRRNSNGSRNGRDFPAGCGDSRFRAFPALLAEGGRPGGRHSPRSGPVPSPSHSQRNPGRRGEGPRLRKRDFPGACGAFRFRL